MKHGYTGYMKDHSASCLYILKDGRLHVLYEAASLKYYFGILTKGRYVHSFDFFGLKI